MLEMIVTGGQTGVDRAALDVALRIGFPCGGWCPKGRKAEDGVIAERYPLKETPNRRYRERTEWNVRDSDATLILATGHLTGGTGLTQQFAIEYDKPCLRVDLADPPSTAWVYRQLIDQRIRVLNIAGPRESTEPGVYAKTQFFLEELLTLCPIAQNRNRAGRNRNGSN